MLFLQTLLLVRNKKYTEYLFDGNGGSHGYKHLRVSGPKDLRFVGNCDVLKFLPY